MWVCAWVCLFVCVGVLFMVWACSQMGVVAADAHCLLLCCSSTVPCFAFLSCCGRGGGGGCVLGCACLCVLVVCLVVFCVYGLYFVIVVHAGDMAVVFCMIGVRVVYNLCMCGVLLVWIVVSCVVLAICIEVFAIYWLMLCECFGCV